MCRTTASRECASVEKSPVGGVVELEQIGIPKPLEKGVKDGQLVVWHFEGGEDPSEVRTVVAVMKQADVPTAAERVEELHQRARPLGEFEAARPFLPHVVGAATDHVTDVQLRHLVVG